MEKNTERKTLSFEKGMTNVPSDLLSGDDELAESDGFIYRDGEMKPVQKPVKIANIEYKIKYVHKGSDYEYLIAYDEGNGTIYCYPKSGDTYDINNVQSFTIGKVYDIKSVGTTLVCATENGLHYLRLKGDKYIDLGTELPKPKIKVSFENADIKVETTPVVIGSFCKKVECKTYHNSNNKLCKVEYPTYNYNSSNASTLSISTKVLGDETGEENKINYDAEYVVNDIENPDNYKNFKDAIVGHVSSIINDAKKSNLFSFPFFIRCAIRLFDGTYARISNPIICYPTVRYNNEFFPYRVGVWEGHSGESLSSNNYFYNLIAKKLNLAITLEGADNWDDLIQGVAIFASEQTAPFDIDGDWNFAYPNTMYETPYLDGIDDLGYSMKRYTFAITNSSSLGYTTDGLLNTRILPSFKDEKKFLKEILSKSVFYKILFVDKELLDGQEFDASQKMESNVCLNLVEQEQLKVDDYYGWASIAAKKLFPYNNRLNTFEITRKPFDGFNYFRSNRGGNDNASGWIRYYVHIVKSGMGTWVQSEKVSPYNTYDDWYYYPDPCATEMVVEWGVPSQDEKAFYKKIPLQEHPRLNGAYSFNALPPTILDDEENAIKPAMTFGGVEKIDSQIYTTVVNNPFVFEASGDNTVGTGRIIDIAANTEAVSQGQFGQYPLLVFTSEGIYGLSVNSEGLYSASYPISREVCNDDSPIIPTDKLIFFASKKGLMATSGGTVACMSEQMRGRIARNFSQFSGESFLKFLEGCVIAYDYRDSLLRIFNPAETHHYIYNMEDKTFAMVNDGVKVQAAVNNYPDNLIQDTDGNVYSLTGKPDINDDSNEYSGSFVSRPLKLGGSITLKSLRAIKNLVDSDNGSVTLEIYGSNDCKNWQKLTSLGGKPWKYFTIKYNISNFKACDSFSGSVVEIQTRREDKMR